MIWRLAWPGSGRAGRRGQGLVEVALVLPVFLLILMILLDFGRVVFAQQVLNQDAREATRAGSLSVGQLKTPDDWVARYAAIRAAAKKMSVGVTLSDADIVGDVGACPIPLPPDPTTLGHCFYPDGFLSAAVDPGAVRVHITVQLPILTPIISHIFGGSVTLTGSSDAEIHS